MITLLLAVLSGIFWLILLSVVSVIVFEVLLIHIALRFGRGWGLVTFAVLVLGDLRILERILGVSILALFP